MDASHIFPHSVLAFVPLMVVIGGVVSKAHTTGCEVQLPLCSVAVWDGVSLPAVGVEALKKGLAKLL